MHIQIEERDQPATWSDCSGHFGCTLYLVKINGKTVFDYEQFDSKQDAIKSAKTVYEQLTDPDLCVDCRQTTKFGSGRYVNRIPADLTDDRGEVIGDGYMCAECLPEECIECGSISCPITGICEEEK